VVLTCSEISTCRCLLIQAAASAGLRAELEAWVKETRVKHSDAFPADYDDVISVLEAERGQVHLSDSTCYTSTRGFLSTPPLSSSSCLHYAHSRPPSAALEHACMKRSGLGVVCAVGEILWAIAN
jgi:hypothetical protein